MNIRKGLRSLLSAKGSDVAQGVEATRRRAIHLRRVYPPDRDVDTVGHFGGLPRLPSEIEWPRDAGTGTPMMFVAAVDLARLPVFENAEGLPTSGTLLFFIIADGNRWDADGETPMGHVIHLPDGVGKAAERSPPTDAVPCFGDSWMYSFKRFSNSDDAPRSFDRWPIEARAKDSFCSIIPAPNEDRSGAGKWMEDAARRNLEATFLVYGRDAPKRRYHEDINPLPPPPYPQFWRMIEAAAGEIRFSTQFTLGSKWDPLSAKARLAYQQAHDEATAWAQEAGTHAPWNEPLREDRIRFRDWISDLDSRTYFPPGEYSPKNQAETIHLVSGRAMSQTMAEALDELMALDPARLRAVMPEAEGHVAWRHAAIIDEQGDKKIVEHQMLGWGTEVQDVVSEHQQDVLLLQLDSDYGIRWMWGDCGVIQFWIGADDLRDLRFDRVMTTFAGH